MRNKTVADDYTPLHSVYMLDINRKLDKDTMKEVRLCSNYSALKEACLLLACCNVRCSPRVARVPRVSHHPCISPDVLFFAEISLLEA